jgi:hypothetical protein
MAMKISSLSFEPQDMLTAVDQVSQQRSSLENAERTAPIPLRDHREARKTRKKFPCRNCST